MKKSGKRVISLVLALVLVLSAIPLTFAADGNECPLKTEIFTSKDKYSTYAVVKFTVKVTNTSDEAVENISVESLFNDLAPLGSKSVIKAEKDSLAPGGVIEFSFKATLNKNTIPLKGIQKSTLGFVRMWYKNIPVVDNGFDDGRTHFDTVKGLSIGKFVVTDVVRVWFGDGIGEISLAYPDEDSVETEIDSGIVYIDNEILIVASNDSTYTQIEELARTYHAIIVGYIEVTRDYQLKLNSHHTYNQLQSIIADIENNSIVESATLNLMIESEEDFYPSGSEWNGNDDDWSEKLPQGQNWGVEAVKAPSAWNYRSEMSQIKVGLIDSGFDTNHEDLSYSYVSNGNIADPGGHGTHVSGIMAANFYNNQGIAGVYTNSNINGVSTNALSRFSNNTRSDGYISSAGYKTALAELILRNVKVINISQNSGRILGFAADRGVRKAINVIESNADIIGEFLHRLIVKGYDFVIVTAAGNNSSTYSAWQDLLFGSGLQGSTGHIYTKVDTTTEHPYGYREYKQGDSYFNVYYGTVSAKYNSYFNAIDNYQDVVDRIIVTGSIYNKGIDTHWFSEDTHKGYDISKFSNICNRVDIVAPGEDIYSTLPNNQYGYMGGTSMAAPHVTGVAAITWSVNTALKGSEVKEIVCDTANRPVSMKTAVGGIEYTFNIVNAEASVKEAISRRTGTSTIVPMEYGCGIGKVVLKSDESQVFEDAIITAYSKSDDVYKGSATTDADGQYEIILPAGEYNLITFVEGYIPYIINNVRISSQEVSYLEWSKLVPDDDQNLPGNVWGNITNAMNGTAIPEVSLAFTNSLTGSFAGAAITNSSGQYNISLPEGYYSVQLSKDGFVSTVFTVASSSQLNELPQNATLTPILPEGQYRMILSWGANPSDLDSHLTGPLAGGGSFHVYYMQMDAYNGDTLVANLDLDDVDGEGPETLTLTPDTNGTFKYYIHKYAGDGSISTSNAQVKLYKGNSLIATYNAPTNQGTGIYWNVFKIENGVIKNVNTITNSPS